MNKKATTELEKEEIETCAVCNQKYKRSNKFQYFCSQECRDKSYLNENRKEVIEEYLNKIKKQSNAVKECLKSNLEAMDCLKCKKLFKGYGKDSGNNVGKCNDCLQKAMSKMPQSRIPINKIFGKL